MSTETIERSFNAPAPARLKVGNIRGHVSVKPHPDPAAGTILVTALRHDREDETTQVEINQEPDGMVRVETRQNEETFGFGWLANLLGGRLQPGRVDYTITVPAECSVEVRCISSTAEVEGLTGSFDFDMISGDLTLTNLQGSLEVKTVSGDVHARGITAPTAELKTVSGNMRVEEAQIDTIRGNSVSGNITIATRLTVGPYTFKSISGDVRLMVPEDNPCSLEMSSISGSIRSNRPGNQRGRGPHQSQQIQGGGPSVRLRTTSGDLILNFPEGAQAEPPEPPAWEAPAPQPEPASTDPEAVEIPLDRQTILEKIESGELSVEEGIALLKTR